MVRRIVLALGVLALAAAPLSAQSEVVRRSVVSVNPLGIVFGVYNAEYERVWSPSITLGAAGTLWSDETEDVGFGAEEFTYFSADAKVRFYPGGANLRGFSLGGLAGFTRISEVSTSVGNSTVNAATLGVELDYGWLLGQQRNFHIGLGLGAKRLIPLGDDTDANLAYPIARLSVGYAF